MVARDLAELRLAEERASATETRFAALVEHVQAFGKFVTAARAELEQRVRLAPIAGNGASPPDVAAADVRPATNRYA